jgi:hypothetical protein
MLRSLVDRFLRKVVLKVAIDYQEPIIIFIFLKEFKKFKPLEYIT